MKVRELITELEKMGQEKDVYSSDIDYGWVEINYVAEVDDQHPTDNTERTIVGLTWRQEKE